MTPLPKRPERSAPIPNDPFDSPEITAIKGPYWDMALGSGLEADGNGSVQTAGSEPSAPTAYLYGSNGFVGVGAGLQIGASGDIELEYIYCTPQYSNLPVTYPPYGSNTEVNTAGVTNFANAWSNVTEMPCVDTSSGIDFTSTWSLCPNLTSFPSLNFSNAEIFDYTWAYLSDLVEFPLINTGKVWYFYGTWLNCSSLSLFPKIDTSSGTYFGNTWDSCTGLTSFPSLDVSSGENFDRTWQNCSGLTSFPALNFSSGQYFPDTWRDCTSLVNFPANLFDTCQATNFSSAWYNCALSQQSVDNILVSLDTAGQSNGIVNIDGGTSSAPGAAGLAAKASLQAKGWTVLTN